MGFGTMAGPPLSPKHVFVPGLFEPEVSAETSPAQIQVLHSEQLMFDQPRSFLHAFFDQIGTGRSGQSGTSERPPGCADARIPVASCS